MPIAVEVVSREDFDKWVVAKGGSLTKADAETAAAPAAEAAAPAPAAPVAAAPAAAAPATK
jgi:cytochrome c oxidase subunit 2